MADYSIIWRIEVTADSAMHAAKVARDIQLDPESTATVFEVDGEEVCLAPASESGANAHRFRDMLARLNYIDYDTFVDVFCGGHEYDSPEELLRRWVEFQRNPVAAILRLDSKNLQRVYNYLNS